MRTTVTLDPDVEALIKKVMREKKLTFKQALNAAIRRGLIRDAKRGFETPSFRMGFDPEVPFTKALEVAGELEDEELTRRADVGK
jgi:hypothetical protein